MSRPRSWTDDDLRRAIAVATSWNDVTRALDLVPSGHTQHLLRKRAWALHLSTAHFGGPGGSPIAVVVDGTPAQRRARSARAGPRWSDDDLAAAVARAISWAGVHRELGMVIGGSTYPMLQRRSRELGLDTSHFTGRGWRTGASVPPPGVRIPLAEILVEGSTYTSTHSLRLRLIREGLKEERCEECGLSEWRGATIPLQLDHVNGRRSDNRLQNLRILCANCHAQTDTWCGKNKRHTSPSWRNRHTLTAQTRVPARE